jgi:hypothetical protein
MEISGIDPKLMICKITVLPIKLYPLLNKNTLSGVRTRDTILKELCRNHLTIRV